MPRSFAENWPACPKSRSSACPRRRWRRPSGTRSPRSAPTRRVFSGSNFHPAAHQVERKAHGGSTSRSLVRHDAPMDRRALERLGHHVVSRRVALGFRSRTDLASSLQFTVRTLADIEHGVRKASPGTYAMLENKLAWAPGSIDRILAGGEPDELVSSLRRPDTSPAPQRLRTAGDEPQCAVAGAHRGAVARAATPHHRPARSTPRHLG